MRYVDRQSVNTPELFATREAAEAREALLQVFGAGRLKMAQSRVESFGTGYSVIRDKRLIEPLAALFDGCCAFCESPLRDGWVHRFRPAAAAEPVRDPSNSHLYYAWLAEAWQNLYPICADCAPAVPAYFPVNGPRCNLPDMGEIERFLAAGDGAWPDFPPDERPLLLDPCQDKQLWRHLRFHADGRVSGKSNRGRETIAHFRLDRPALVEARRAAIGNALGLMRHALLDPFEPLLAQLPAHRGAIELLLREVFAEALGGRRKSDLEAQRAALVRLPDGPERFNRAVLAFPLGGELEAGFGLPQLAMAAPAPAPEKRATPDSFISVGLRNFKSLERIELTLPKPRKSTGKQQHAPSILILGENATGKSTILEAIALAVMTPAARARLKFNPGRAVLNPKYMGVMGHEMPLESVIALTHSGGVRRLTLTHRQQNPGQIGDRGPPPHIPLFAYGAFRQYLDKERNFSPHKHVRSLFEPEWVLSNPEAWLAKLGDTHFNMVVRALREVFSIEGNFEVIERGDDGIFVVSDSGDAGNGKPRREPISLVSSGFRAVLAMLCDIMQGLMDRRINPGFQSLETARGLVLIDEVEAHLHPRWKLSIMTGLRRALPQVSFIATSHDPLCLRGMGPGEVMVLERLPGKAGGTDLPIFTQALTDLPDNDKWTIEQLLTADFFQLRSTESMQAERRAARMEDKLARNVRPEDDAELAAYLAEFTRDLPIGQTQVHRLVQEAIE
ncbi:MAG TPA: hypothetical protein ENK41_02380, partial [Rhodobacteraceae bacterium]|nr:hypothetical protein [Paracoccaceae bacterium]